MPERSTSRLVESATLVRAADSEPLYGESIDGSVLANLQALAADGAPDILSELIELFAESTPQLIGAARAALHDPSVLSSFAHAMKGSCSNFGARRMQTLCGELEELGRGGNTSGADKLVSAIENEYKEVRRLLEQYHVAA